jgi:uncharacterized protein YjiS (DUF1127 family)
MSSIYSAPAAGMAGRQYSVLATLRQCGLSYVEWRFGRAAVADLSAMRDRELRDIGLLRSQVTRAVPPQVTYARTTM